MDGDKINPEARTESIEFRVTPEEKRFLKKEAKSRGVKLSVLIRQALSYMFGW